MSDDVVTAQTVAYMDELADRDAGDRIVIDATHQALDEASIDMTADTWTKACAIFWFLKRTIRYVPTPGTSPLVDQTLIPPSTLLAMPDPHGDCPQFSMLAKAMMQVCCIPAMFKTIAAEPEFPDVYSHIYNVVVLGPNLYVPFDSSNGPEPGTEYSRPFKRRVWPTKPIRCRETSMQRRTTIRHDDRGLRSSSLYGALGDDGSDSTVNWDFGAPVSNDVYVSSDPYSNSAADSTGTYSLPPTFGSGSGSVPISNLLTTLANDATSLVSPLIKAATAQKPYYITNPATGQSVLYNPNTGSSAVGASALASINPTVLIVGGLLFVGLAMAKK